MKIICENDNLTIFLQKKYDEKNIKKLLKDTIMKIKKRYHKKISGFYNAIIYQNDLIGMIIELKKDDDFDIFSDVIDLNINVSRNNDILLEFDNPYLITSKNKVYYYDKNYYISIKNITKKEYYKLIEFCNIKYGNEQNEISTKMKKIILKKT